MKKIVLAVLMLASFGAIAAPCGKAAALGTWELQDKHGVSEVTFLHRQFVFKRLNEDATKFNEIVAGKWSISKSCVVTLDLPKESHGDESKGSEIESKPLHVVLTQIDRSAKNKAYAGVFEGGSMSRRVSK